MRTKSITIALATFGLVAVGCSKDDERYEWGYAYQPDQAGIDTVGKPGSDEDPAEDEDDSSVDEPASSSSGDPNDSAVDPTNDPTSGSPTTTTDPTDDSAGGSSSTGVPNDSSPPESPYQGGWDIGDCQNEMDGSIADFQLADQFGDSVRLADFCHKAVLLVAGAFW